MDHLLPNVSFGGENIRFRLAMIIITDCVAVNDEIREVLRKKNFAIYEGTTENNSWHGYGFKIENVEKIDLVLANGKLGLWEYEI